MYRDPNRNKARPTKHRISLQPCHTTCLSVVCHIRQGLQDGRSRFLGFSLTSPQPLINLWRPCSQSPWHPTAHFYGILRTREKALLNKLSRTPHCAHCRSSPLVVAAIRPWHWLAFETCGNFGPTLHMFTSGTRKTPLHGHKAGRVGTVILRACARDYKMHVSNERACQTSVGISQAEHQVAQIREELPWLLQELLEGLLLARRRTRIHANLRK